MDAANLKKIAAHIRAKLEAVPFARELNRCSVLMNFPKDCCQIASLCCLYYLKKNRLVGSKQLFLLANAEIKPGHSHAWALVDGHHIDLTADQFCNDKVIVSINDPWPDILKSPNPYPFDDEWLMEDYEADLIRLCNFIDEQP